MSFLFHFRIMVSLLDHALGGCGGVGSGSEHLLGPQHPEDVAFIIHFSSSLCSPEIEQKPNPQIKWKFRG